MVEEIWVDIKGYEGLYQVSNLGRVKSLERIDSLGHKRKEKILKPRKNKDGYLQVVLCKEGKYKEFRVHRLVAIAFIPNTDNKPFIDHINTIRDDNRVENLRWVTHEENINNPLSKENKSESMKGKKKKLVYCFETDKTYPSIRQCAKELGLNKNAISQCCNGKRKHHKGYHFYYVEDILYMN